MMRNIQEMEQFQRNKDWKEMVQSKTMRESSFSWNHFGYDIFSEQGFTNVKPVDFFTEADTGASIADVNHLKFCTHAEQRIGCCNPEHTVPEGGHQSSTDTYLYGPVTGRWETPHKINQIHFKTDV